MSRGAYDALGLATPQTLAKVQDEQIERDRRRRVKEANLAAYEGAREADANRRGGSVFSYTPRESVGEPVGDGVAGTASNTVFGPQTGNMPIRSEWDVLDSQARIGSEFADLARRSAAVRQHNARIGVDSISAAMRSARSNGGRLPQNAVDMLSRNLGLDGKTSAVYGAGYLGNGDFDIDIVTRGANGGLQRTTKKITPLEQLGIVNSTPGVWGNDGIAMFNQLYSGLRNTMGKSELPPQGVYAENLRAYNTKKEGAEMQKFLISCAQEAIKAASKADPKSGTRVDPKTAFLQRALLNDKVRAEIMQGTEPELDKDGNPVIGDDGNQVMKPASDEVQRSRLEDLANRAFMFFQGGQGGPQGGRAEAQMQVVNQILNRLYPPTPPDVAAFQQRQRERQMREVEEAQAREDITRRQQQVINYFKDGKWYSGNGYVRDGKVYDGQGYEIEGATPAEMARGADGGVFSNERGWFARALPSARELVGGRGGAEAQGGGVQGGGVNWTPGHDLRNDGKTYKGTGWLGVLRLPNGGVASEYTVGVEIGGKEIDIPTLVPTLTKEEQDLMVNDIIPNNKDVPDSILKKAVDFAKMRLANGRSVFANDGTPQQAQQPAAQTQGEQPVATQPAQDGQIQPAAAQEQVGVQSGDLLAPENADAFIADVNKGLDPEKSRAIEIEAAAKAEKARRQKQSAEPIDDREWADEMKQLNESTGGVVQRDRGAEARTAARDFFSSVFDDIARDAAIAADRAVAFDEEHVGAGKGISRDEAYRNAFRSLVNKRLGEMSEDDRRRLERVDPGNLKSPKINLRQSLYDRYGVDVYDGGRGFVGAITGVGNLDNRGGYYEDLVDSDGNVKKGTWRRGGDAYGEYGRSVSLWR